MKNEIRIPLDQYAYINVMFEGTPEETLKEYRRLIKLSKTPVEPEIDVSSNLKPVEMLRLLHKYLVTNRLELEDIESLGTDKIYSQKDVVGLIKNVLAKVSRDAGSDRINKETDIRYN